MKLLEEYKKIPKNKGAAMMISVLFFLFLSIAIVGGLVAPTVNGFRTANADVKSKKAYSLAESGVEDVAYRLLNNIPVTENESITLDSNTVTTTMITTSGNQKQIESLGDVSNFERKVNLTLTTSDGVAFNYGVQVGQGGLDLQGSSGIVGNVYANGPITGTSACYITGTAISGNSPALEANQANGSSSTPDYNVNFGNANATQDVAQSFQTSEATPLNKVQIYVKKVGSPNNATVKIVNNSNGSPGSTVYASGTLAASSVTTNYGWIDVSFSTNPMLNTNTTYWLVVDASTSSSKYYVIGASSGTYSSGIGKIGQQGGTWNSTSPAGLDYFFKVYLGGFTGLIAGSSGSQWNQFQVGTDGSGTAQAHTVNYTRASGNIYCQSGTGNNKACVSQADPVYQAMPISDANIAQWKADAELGGTYSGTYNTASYSTSNLGPRKITGDLNVGGSHVLYLTGTVYVQGNVNVSGAARIVLSPSYGNTSGILISDGRLSLSGSGQLNGSGQSGSYILFVTTSNCDASFCPSNAIDISGAAGSVILNAQNGTIGFSGSASAKEATAFKMSLSGATVVNYESGLANINFTSGPSGSWSIQNWGETE
jgi:hypothetical protein